MRRGVAAMLALLPLDAESRRAIEETLADWRHEAGMVRSPAGSVVVALTGLAAVTQAVARVTMRELGSVQMWRLAAAVAGLALLLGFAMTTRPVGMFAVELAERAVPLSTVLAIMLTMVPQALSSCLPLALLTPPFKTERGSPLLGLILVLVLLAGANLVWVTPIANEQFAIQMEQAIGQEGLLSNIERSTGAVPRGNPTFAGMFIEPTVLELIERAGRPSFEGLRARQALSDRAAFIAYIPAFMLLGIHARRFSQHCRWRWGGGLLAYAVAAFGAFPATFLIIAVQSLLRSHFHPADEIRMLQNWVLPLVAVLGAMLLSRTSSLEAGGSIRPGSFKRP